jgi:hypothetical protein
MRVGRMGIILAFSAFISGAKASTSFSFTGTFITDDQLELFEFTAPSTSVTLQTFGYGGGMNQAGTMIPAGGFAPILSVFNATGGLTSTSPLVTFDFSGCTVGNVNPATGNAFDCSLNLTTLNPGDTYVVVLSEVDNAPSGGTFGDGFNEAGKGNFTAALNGCLATGPFCDPGGLQNDTGNWAVDIDGVGSASDITGGGVPEPSSTLLFGAGIGVLALLRRRKGGVHDSI